MNCNSNLAKQLINLEKVIKVFDSEYIYNNEPVLETKMFGSYVKQAGFPIWCSLV